LQRNILTLKLGTADKKYDLDFKTPNNSGTEVKTGDEMIEMYKSFCKGGLTCFPYQLMIFSWSWLRFSHEDGLQFILSHVTGLFHRKKISKLKSKKFKVFKLNVLMKIYFVCKKDYPIISIEDPFDQDDWDHTKKLTDLNICQVGCSSVSFFSF
jgi:hypothetical protein